MAISRFMLSRNSRRRLPKSHAGSVGNVEVQLETRRISWLERRRMAREVHVPRGKPQPGWENDGAWLFTESGQMSVELCVVFPVVIAIALVVVNAFTFFSECAQFDRVGRNNVRIVATSPEHGQNIGQSIAAVKNAIESQVDQENVSVDVMAQNDVNGYATYKMTMHYYPTLFGMGLVREVFGVQMPSLSHETQLTVCPYKPGIFI